MIFDIGQNRSYHNNWSLYIDKKIATVKSKIKNWFSETTKNKIKINQTELSTTIIYLFHV